MEMFWGKVQQGDKTGRELGFPTANMMLHKHIAEGIYAAKVRIGEKFYESLTFIGKARTFGKTAYLAEAHILDFQGNLYDMFITVRLLKKLRDNKKFDSEDSLIEQMKKDEKEARIFFKQAKE